MAERLQLPHAKLHIQSLMLVLNIVLGGYVQPRAMWNKNIVSCWREVSGSNISLNLRTAMSFQHWRQLSSFSLQRMCEGCGSHFVCVCV